MNLCGFNITDFMGMGSVGITRLDDFALIRRLGFGFVRIPLNYRLWSYGPNQALDEKFLKRLDCAVFAALDQGVHVCLAMHRAPGYTVSREGREPGNLWRDPALQADFVRHWCLLAERYAFAGPDQLSFNLINEPGPLSQEMTRDDHERVIRLALKAIDAVNGERIVVADGINWGRDPHPELADTGVWQSCRGYEPFVLTHFGTRRRHPLIPDAPHWPMEIPGKGTLDRIWLRARFKPWFKMLGRGTRVHCGEFGCSRSVPHDVMLMWMTDLLSVFGEMNIGFALWNFRGPFGVVDSNRTENIYDATPYGRIDRAMLELLQEYAAASPDRATSS